ncbi:MAG TPA: L-threonylcarbamoyladenylate synthase [Patescibacteria group bacterium]|nr:L-threonylcarbamoyladenylate synthase [Patescibacteria group bacterium]
MVPRVLPGDDPDAICEAAALLRAGQPVAFPTETVYGLGADALDPTAVARVFAAKERPSFDPLIVHLADAAELARHVDPADAADPRVERLAARFWPGPLTIVLRKLEHIPGIVTAGLPTVGLRVPDHPVAVALIRAAGVPLAAPSANRFGRVSPTRASHVVRGLGSRVGLILDGGPCRIGVESTVVLLAGGRAALLRPGGLPLEAIEAEIGPLDIVAPGAPGSAALAPGGSATHYAPGARLEIVDPFGPGAAGRLLARPGERLGLLATSTAGAEAALAAGGQFAAQEVLATDGDPVTVAARLFEALHDLDAAGLDRIVAQPVRSTGLGRAVMDRLRRAARETQPGP